MNYIALNSILIDTDIYKYNTDNFIHPILETIKFDTTEKFNSSIKTVLKEIMEDCDYTKANL